MKHILRRAALAALIALCGVLAAPGLTEGPPIVDDAFKITFITAEFNDNWEEYAGEAPSRKADDCPGYFLRVYVMDGAATDDMDRLTDRTIFWHLVDPAGNIYTQTQGSYYQTDGLYRELNMVFRCSEPVGPAHFDPGELTLEADWGGPTYALDGVPQDEPAEGPDPTPEPTETPEDIDRVNALFKDYKSRAIPQKVVEPVLTGRLAVVVYRDWDDQAPVISYRDDLYVRDRIPADRLAASLEEADTLVFIWPEFESVGMYDSGAFAHRCMTKVGVIDLAGDSAYLPETVATNDPPATVHDRKAHSGNYEPATAVGRIVGLLEEK